MSQITIESGFWGCADLGLARALHNGSPFDYSIELEAAVLVDGGHYVELGVACLDGIGTLEGGRLDRGDVRADGDWFGGRLLGLCCHGRGHDCVTCMQ